MKPHEGRQADTANTTRLNTVTAPANLPESEAVLVAEGT